MCAAVPTYAGGIGRSSRVRDQLGTSARPSLKNNLKPKVVAITINSFNVALSITNCKNSDTDNNFSVLILN
jgi:hypothetical protein